MKKISIIIMNIILLVSPVAVFAEEEQTTPTPSPTPTASPVATPTPTPTNTPEPTATPEATATPEPTSTATPEEDIIENTLSKIEVTGGELSPAFNSNKYKYKIKVTDDKNFKITYEKSDNRTDVAAPELNSSNQLDAIVNKDKKTTITVYYTDKAGKQHTNTYKLELEYDVPEKSAKLKSLRVEVYELDQPFQSTMQRYAVEIPNLIDTITIVAEPEDSDATITYNGKEENIVKGLSVGENNIKIVVKNGKVTNTYYLNVTRKDAEQEDEENLKATAEALITKVEKRIKDLGDKLADEDKEETEKLIKDLKEAIEGSDKDKITEAKDKLNENFKKLPKVEQEEDNKKEEKPKVNVPDANPVLNRIIVTVATLIGFALGGFGIYFYIKTSPKRMKKELMKLKENKETKKESPIVEVKSVPVEELNEVEDKKVIRDDLVETKEFKMEDENKDA